jgi:putative ribosome biogenesis GTPase RsgA
MQNDFDRELQNYFTDVEHLRELFRQWLVAPTLSKRMLVIHGVGGVGKSSLLRMFRLHCKSVGVPVALASGDE